MPIHDTDKVNRLSVIAVFLGINLFPHQDECFIQHSFRVSFLPSVILNSSAKTCLTVSTTMSTRPLLDASTPAVPRHWPENMCRRFAYLAS